MVVNDQLASLLFHVNQRPSNSSNKTISNFDLETSRSRSWVRSEDHTVSPVSDWFAFFLFHINQITIPGIQLFWNLTLKKSKVKVMCQVKGQGHVSGQRSRSHSSPSIQQIHLLFVSHQSDQPFLRYVQQSVWPWKNTWNFQRKHIWNFQRNA